MKMWQRKMSEDGSTKAKPRIERLVIFLYILMSMIYESELTISDYHQNNVNDFGIADGKRSYEAALTDSKLPKFGTCWKNALAKLNSYCKKLTDDKQHRLALYFTNCFLKKIGSADYSDCENDNDFSACTSKMKDSDRGIYSNFFTHAQNMCRFLQMSVWHELTERTISNLAQSSESVAEQLSESARVQDEIIEKQRESLKNQHGIITSGERLNEAIRSSSDNVHQMFEDYKRTTAEQRLMISEVFDRVSSLQSIVLGEFTGFYSLIFYATSILISYILTSTPRTSAARFGMFLVMTGDIIFERFIVSYSSHSADINDVNEELYRRLWLCRKLFWLFGLSVLCHAAYNYTDINVANNQLLMEIKKEISVVKSRVSLDVVTDGTLPIKPASIGNRPNAIMPPVENCRNMSVCAPDYHDSSSSDDEESDLDVTYKLFSVSDDEYSDNESICSNGTDFSSHSMLLEELCDLRESTPIRQLEREKKRQSRQFWSDESSSHQYNLRRRSNDKPNPLIFSETPRRFAKTIKSLTKHAIRNRFEMTNNTSYTIEKTFLSMKE
ncbi:uncharacterized protein LOC141902353 [Tubulanus polymorphus]|uniref:uncharacterized protein LOC141902353 n=1 Tax=Tubulanus polymorphus TaxID=672921 RepID=UPI003DA5CF77